jgi:glycosyltransferase involved in cell wall biosynthesis
VPNASRREIYRSRFRLSIDRALERRVLSSADAIVTVSEAQRDLMRSLTPDARRGRHHVITNGYESEWRDHDPEESPHVEARPDTLLPRLSTPSAPFTIAYTGSFYRAGERPDPLFRALGGLLASGAVPRGDLRVIVAGPQHERVASAARRFGIEDAVDTLQPLPHADALRLQRTATVLWLALSAAHGAQGALTAKLFEYMAARRPVLAIVPPGSEAGAIVRRTGLGMAVDPCDAVGLQRAVFQLHDEYRVTGSVQCCGNEVAIESFTRARLTGHLAAILDDIVADGVR